MEDLILKQDELVTLGGQLKDVYERNHTSVVKATEVSEKLIDEAKTELSAMGELSQPLFDNISSHLNKLEKSKAAMNERRSPLTQTLNKVVVKSDLKTVAL